MKYLLIRISAIGDVAMTIPLVYEIAKSYPQHQFTFLTQPFLTSLFIKPPHNLEAMGIDVKNDQKRLADLVAYAWDLKREGFDVIVDLHNVIRSKIIRTILSISNIKTKVFHIKKNRVARAKLVAKPPLKIKDPLVPMQQIYRNAFQEAGLTLKKAKVESPFTKSSDLTLLMESKLKQLLHLAPQEPLPLLIGVAPFAGHKGKIYPLDKLYDVCCELVCQTGGKILLFSGVAELSITQEWQKKNLNLIAIGGKFSLPEELEIIRLLRLMITMDSANMHFAALVGTPTLSIWMATHPFAGFLGLGQNENGIVTLNTRCSPCSIFGDKECYKGTYECKNIAPKMIVDKAISMISI